MSLKHKNTYLICSDDEHPNWKNGDDYINGCAFENDLASAISLAIVAAKSTGVGFIVQFKNSAFITRDNETTTIEIKPTDNSVRSILSRFNR